MNLTRCSWNLGLSRIWHTVMERATLRHVPSHGVWRREICGLALGLGLGLAKAGEPSTASPAFPHDAVVEATSLRGKIMCGYQGWFRCRGDASGLGWIHWSRDSRRIATNLLTFEMWPDLTEYSKAERFPTPDFAYPDGRTAELFSSDNALTVQRHFQWMRDYGLDGAWLQHFSTWTPYGSTGA